MAHTNVTTYVLRTAPPPPAFAREAGSSARACTLAMTYGRNPAPCTTPGFGGVTDHASTLAFDENELFMAEAMDISKTPTVGSFFSMVQLVAVCFTLVQFFMFLLLAAKVIPWSHGGDLSLYLGIALGCNVVLAFAQLAAGIRTAAGGPTFHFLYHFRTWPPTVFQVLITLVQIILYRETTNTHEDGYVVGALLGSAGLSCFVLIFWPQAVYTNLRPPIVRPINDVYFQACSVKN